MHLHEACRVCGTRFRCDGSGCDQPSDATEGPVCKGCSRALCEAEERLCYLCVEEAEEAASVGKSDARED